MSRKLMALAALMALGACGDPLRDVTRLSDVEVTSGAASIAEVPASTQDTRGGLFAGLLNRSPEDPTTAAVEAALADASVVAQPQEQSRGGLFGLFRANRSAAAPVAEAELVDVATSDVAALAEGEETITLAAAPVQNVEPTERRGLGGLFGRRSDTPAAPERYDGPDAEIVPAGTLVPFGSVARVCDLPRNPGGRETSRFDGLRLYDAIPNSTALRPHYVTGFDDNCARTFAGAVVIPGSIEGHEFVRYQPSNSGIAYTAVDNAYEALKQRVCRVGRGQPCGARTEQLERDTQFLTIYNNFGEPNPRWMQLLIYQGRVLAVALKEG